MQYFKVQLTTKKNLNYDDLNLMRGSEGNNAWYPINNIAWVEG
jgi:hypothetical protein